MTLLSDPVGKHFRLKLSQKQALVTLGIETVRDLLYHFPSRFADEAKEYSGDANKGDYLTAQGTISTIRMRKSMGKTRVMLTEATIKTDNKTLRAMWFNQPYIASKFSKGDVVQVRGSITGIKTKYMANPEIVLLNALNTDLSAGLENMPAVYRETKGVSSLWFRSVIRKISPSLSNLEDPIPEKIRKGLNLPKLSDAFQYMHMPKSLNDYEIARKRFAFEEVFFMQLVQQKEVAERAQANTFAITTDKKSVDTFMKDRFEFTPTKAQKTVIKEILSDIKSDVPMSRLLEGDVGSGKTAVAAAALYAVAAVSRNGSEYPILQSAYMAPTEILAKQQFDTIVELFHHLPITIGLITGKTCLRFPSKVNPSEATSVPRAQFLKHVADGSIAIVVGTHALIQKSISFRNLAFTVIDEQHRFGIRQRKELTSGQEKIPHLLSMTATPIPRTLALTIYGDLSLSLLDELPKGRAKVTTHLLQTKKKDKAYKAMEKGIADGRQGYVICPRVWHDDESPLHSVEKETEYLKEKFPKLRIASIHGQLKPKEKNGVMEDFKKGDYDMLVSTSVIEVGINVPNSTNIVILNAERFGLAQLHQLRGRVIRSSHKSTCFVVSDSDSEMTRDRLDTFKDIHNGFELAEKDLDMRGAGELMGVKQSGAMDLIMEALRNISLVSFAQKGAKDTLKKKTMNKALVSELTRREYIHTE